jgi:hypothetical protein
MTNDETYSDSDIVPTADHLYYCSGGMWLCDKEGESLCRITPELLASLARFHSERFTCDS